jgi:hypothetical protein
VSDTSVIDLTVDAVLPAVQAAEDPESIFHPSVSILCNALYRVTSCE